jgi:hypothetical protein
MSKNRKRIREIEEKRMYIKINENENKILGIYWFKSYNGI